jgi:hypothetical protein
MGEAFFSFPRAASMPLGYQISKMFQPPSFRQGMPESSAMDGHLLVPQVYD